MMTSVAGPPYMASAHGFLTTGHSAPLWQAEQSITRMHTHTPITETTIDCRDIGLVATMGLGCEPDMQQTGMGRVNELMVTDAIAVS